ncbi:hypothetical protein GCM10028818_22530 [Spirosoma horti]
MTLNRSATNNLVFAFINLFLLVALVGCHHPSIDYALGNPPTQRPKATTTLYLDLTANLVNLDTVQMGGIVYSVLAQDSMRFSYDNQQRLIKVDLTHSSQDYGKKIISPTVSSTYAYQNNQLSGREYFTETYAGRPFQYPLDSSNHRVLAYTRYGYSFVDYDSLRQYSGEGILLNALQTSFNPSFPNIKRQIPNSKATIEGGNITHSEVYSSWTSDLVKINRFSYDMNHYAALATFPFLGETSRNVLLRKTVITYYGNEVDTSNYIYTNEYDNQGRLIRQYEMRVSKDSPIGSERRLTKFYY